MDEQAAASRGPVPAGSWVQVQMTLLAPADRAPNLPADTAALPYLGWGKGFLVYPARPGETASIRTLAGRVLQGRLVAVDAGYDHSFGPSEPALVAIGPALRALLEGEA